MDNEPHLADVIWTNANTQFPPSVKSIMSIATEAIERNAYHTPKPERHFMLIGVPNTGKKWKGIEVASCWTIVKDPSRYGRALTRA